MYENSMGPADMAALMRPNGYGNDMGFGGGAWWWIIILFLFGMNGGWGNGWGGNAGGTGYVGNEVQRGFDQSAVMSGLSDLSGAITAGFGNVQTALCNGFAGVNAGVANGFAQAEIANNARQIANMQQDFALQTALSSQLNGIAMNQQNCCCENRAAVADLKYTVATENCADRQAVSDAANAIMNALNAQTQSLKDQMFNDKMEAKNDLIAQLRSELQFARGQASQDVQTAAIQAGQRTLANEIEQYVAPMARPAYIVSNPYCCNQSVYGCVA